jgi:hypothetical protein
VDNSSVFRNKWMEMVREGMEVVDVDGNSMGTVEFIKMGDPEALTTRGNEPTPSAGVMPMTNESDEPQVPEPLRSDLVRVGFVKIDGKNLFDTDRYFRADTVDRVEGGKVFMKLPEERAAVEGSDELEYEVQPDERVRPGERTVTMPPPAAGLGLPNQNNV